MNDPKRFALVNGRVVLPDKILEGQVVLIENSKIKAITSIDNIGEDTTD